MAADSIERSAVISDDGMYRYRLDRWWGDGPRVVWVMLNPSTADAEQDDPTVRRCIGFSRSWGYDGLTVVNLYPFRATDPAVLEMWLDGNGGEELAENTAMIIVAAHQAPLVVAAWGATRGADGAGALRGLRPWIPQWHHLGLTGGGFPRHPLYVRGDTLPIPFEAVDA